ncbi:isochorismatase family protein [Lactobacillus sp. XV13L]|nr:isochorismatase family protein [Lactobacillus sp. XV13L]
MRISIYLNHQQLLNFIDHIQPPTMAIGSHGWQLLADLQSQPKDIYFNKYYPDSFYETGLKDFLQHRNLDEIEICGAQTQYCLDTTIRVGFHLGFKISVPRHGISTMDTSILTADQINQHHLQIWQGRFAKVFD